MKGRATCLHGNAPVACAPCKYPQLYRAAREIASVVAGQINSRARDLEADTPYKAQAMLEMVIQLLQQAV